MSKHGRMNSEEILKTLKNFNFVIQKNVDELKATQNQLKTSEDEMKANQHKIQVRFCGSLKKCLTANLYGKKL